MLQMIIISPSKSMEFKYCTTFNVSNEINTNRQQLPIANEEL